MNRKGHLGDAIDELVLGLLVGEDEGRAQHHLLDCPQCRADLRHARDAAALLALELEPIAPPPGVADALFSAVARGGRFDEFSNKVAELYGVSPGRARELLRYLDESTRWKPGLVPNTEMMLVHGGDAYAKHQSMFMRVRAGTVFPWHEHVGNEHFVVLEGCCEEPDGTLFRPGSVSCNLAGTAHDFTVPADGPDFLVALRTEIAVRFVPNPNPDRS